MLSSTKKTKEPAFLISWSSERTASTGRFLYFRPKNAVTEQNSQS
jgi:hypothetical protein